MTDIKERSWRWTWDLRDGRDLVLSGVEPLTRDQVAGLDSNMLRHNKIPKLLPVEFEEVDGELKLRYRIPPARSVKYWIQSDRPPLIELLQGLHGIAGILEESRNYMLDEHRYVLDPDYVFVGSYPGDIRMIYVPLTSWKPPASLRQQLYTLATVMFELANLSLEACPTVFHCLRSSLFRVSDFRRLLAELLAETPETAENPLPRLEVYSEDARRDSETRPEPEANSRAAKRPADVGGNAAGIRTKNAPGKAQRYEPGKAQWNPSGHVPGNALATPARSATNTPTETGKETISKSSLARLLEIWQDLRTTKRNLTAVVCFLVLGAWGMAVYRLDESAVYLALGITLLGGDVLYVFGIRGKQVSDYAPNFGETDQFDTGIHVLRSSEPAFRDDEEAIPWERIGSRSVHGDPAVSRMQAFPDFERVSTDRSWGDPTDVPRKDKVDISRQDRTSLPWQDRTYASMPAPTVLLAEQRDATVWLGLTTEPNRQEPEAVLIRLHSDGRRESIPLTGDRQTIGRQEGEADIVETAVGVSRVHGELWKQADGWMYQDLASTNGSRINGLPLQPHKPHPLQDGDKLQLAAMEYEFRLVIT